ncbi:MAG: PIN domain-containing protein [Ruminococcus sp.]|nr:PIN domain-containing protein [Ruminococcus sp.]
MKKLSGRVIQMKMLDTNMIIRYLIRDNEDMAEQVKHILKTEEVLVLPEVIAEVIYVMIKVYEYDRIIVADTLLRFVNLSAVVLDKHEVVKAGLKFFRDTSLDFVDCLLCAYHTEQGYEICTFDKKLNKLIEKNDKI